MSRKTKAVATSALEYDYDTPEGVRAALKAARQGDLSASETLARRLSWIIAGESPYSEDEIDQLIGVAEAGWNSILGAPDCHPEDMYQFAVDILWDDNGDLIRENAENGAAWMLRAAEGRLADAQLEIGRLYYEGVGVKQSDSLAAEWLKKASSDKLNAEHAGYFLGEIKKKSGKTAANKSAAKKKLVAKAVKKAPAKKTAAKAKAPAKKTGKPAKPAAKVAKKPAAKVVKKTKAVVKPVKAVAKKAAKPAVKKIAAKVVAKAVKKAPAKKAVAKKKTPAKRR